MARGLTSPLGVALCVWLALPVRAEDVLFSDQRPSPLIVDGKPVDTYCLMRLANGGSSWRDQIDLSNCSHADIIVKSRSGDPRMIGFEYDYRNSPGQMRQPYFLYRFLGSYRGHSLLFIEHGNGGTGEFTEIDSVDIRGQILTPLQMIAGGDRCNGGVWHASLTGGALFYRQRATPNDLLQLAAKPPNVQAYDEASLRPYSDLEESAASCVADVQYKDAQWTSVGLSDPNLKDQRGRTEQFRQQACFNGVYRAFVARHETELDRSGVNSFAKVFSEQCLHAH